MVKIEKRQTGAVTVILGDLTQGTGPAARLLNSLTQQRE